MYGIEEYSDGAINDVCDDVGTFLDHLASSVDEFDGFKLYGYATGSTRVPRGASDAPSGRPAATVARPNRGAGPGGAGLRIRREFVDYCLER